MFGDAVVRGRVPIRASKCPKRVDVWVFRFIKMRLLLGEANNIRHRGRTGYGESSPKTEPFIFSQVLHCVTF